MSEKNNGPEKTFGAGAIRATVWANTKKIDNKDVVIKTVSLNRSYKDAKGNWQTTDSFRKNDLPKAALVLEEAYKYLVLNAEKEDEE